MNTPASVLRAAADDIRHYATYGLWSPAEKLGMTRAAEVVEYHAEQARHQPALAADGKPRTRLFRFPSDHPQSPGVWAVELPNGYYAKGWFPSEAHHAKTGRYAYPFSRHLPTTYANITADYFRKDIQEGHHT